ncbi:hypothetical protein JCM3774_002828 [Rhodotorula dairenensis]
MATASLLSLPDELLARIFDVVAADLKTLTSSALACRRLRSVVESVLYRQVVVKERDGTVDRLTSTLRRTPSLGQFVIDLKILFPRHLGHYPVLGDTTLGLYYNPSTLGMLHKLKTLCLEGLQVPTLEAILAAVPTSTLAELRIKADVRTENQTQLVQIWARLQAFTRLHTLVLDVVALQLNFDTSRPFLPVERTRLPQLRKLKTLDWFCVALFGDNASLKVVLPDLAELSLSIMGCLEGSTCSHLLRNLPAGLRSLRLEMTDLFNVWPLPVPDVSAGYFSKLPPVRHLRLVNGMFLEDELVAYLPGSHLESIEFAPEAPVTDRLLQLLVGPERPPSHRTIGLDHIADTPIEEVNERFGDEGPTDDDQWAELRDMLRPDWPSGASEEGLRSARETARANGITIEGIAVKVLLWEIIYKGLTERYTIRRACATDDYDEVIERYGEDTVIELLQVHGPNTVRLACAGFLADRGSSLAEEEGDEEFSSSAEEDL